MYVLTISEIKRGRRSGNSRNEPREGTKARKIYDALISGQEVHCSMIDVKPSTFGAILANIDLFYGIETRSVGGGKYVRCG